MEFLMMQLIIGYYKLKNEDDLSFRHIIILLNEFFKEEHYYMLNIE
jgi:hypothetical protein